MSRRRVRWGWISFLVLVLAACGPAAKQEGATPNDTALINFGSLVPPDSPNTWLVAPTGFGPARPDETAPTLDVPPQRLAAIWLQIVREQPRTRVLGISEDSLQIEAAQRSAVFGFTDRISVRVLPMDRGRSTFVAYSRAQVGYWDFGVNRRRLRAWLSALQTRVEEGWRQRGAWMRDWRLMLAWGSHPVPPLPAFHPANALQTSCCPPRPVPPCQVPCDELVGV